MRVIGNKIHPQCNITFFHWNNRYLIKLEAGPFEQTYKVEEYDLTSEAELEKLVDEEFINQTLARFETMASTLGEALSKI